MSNNEKIKVHINDDDDDKTLGEMEDLNHTNGPQTENPSDENDNAADLAADETAALEKAREDAKQAYDKYLRISAEFENYKKRMTRETDEFKKYANEALISDLLPVIDNLERAIMSAKDDTGNYESLVQGIELTLNEILKTFGRYQVEQIDSVEKPFDPNFHQAMLQEETNEYPDNTIIQEMQKGYTIHNRLLRPAMVVVSKATDK